MTNDEMMEMIYTPDTVIKRATEEYIENARADEDTYLAMPLDTLAADLTRVVNGEIAKVNEELKYRRDMLNAEKEKAKGDPGKLAELSQIVVEQNIKMLASPNPYMLASVIMFKHHVIRMNYGTSDSNSTDMCPLAVYNDSGHDEGVYTTDNDTIESIIRDACPTIVQRDVNETKAFLRAMAPVKFRSNDRNLIALNNGVFDYETKMLLGFDPEWVFASKIGTDYNENAKNVFIHNDEDGTDWDFDSWLEELSDEPEAPKLLWQIIGAAVRPNTAWNQAAFFYSTKGNNGKGTLCELIRGVVGKRNCCSLSLDTLGREFMLTPLLKASAIITDENNVGEYLERTANLKAIITGDALNINIKHRDPVSYTFRGFMIQCLNDAPKFRDKTDSMLRRIIFVPFDKCFTGRERKYIKEDYLKRKEVREYVLKHVLEDIPDYYSIEVPQYCKDALDDFRLSNDNVAEFLSEVLDELTWDAISWKELYSFYRGWLRRYGSGDSGRGCVKYRDFRNSVRNILDTGTYGWEYHPGDGQFMVDAAYHAAVEPLIKELDIKDLSNVGNSATADHIDSLKGITTKIRGIRRLNGAYAAA